MPDTPKGPAWALRDIERKKAAKAASPESEVARQRARLLASGQETMAQGVGAIRGFNPEDFLGADALKSIFDEATVTNFLPQLRQLQARNARSGIRGPLKGGTEGDLAAAFQRQLLGKVAEFGSTRAALTLQRGESLAQTGGTEQAQGVSLLGTELELQLAREQAKKEEKAGWRKFIATGLGAGAGFVLSGGNPMGAYAGAKVGSSL